MKTFMRYLRYRLDSTTLRTLILTVISVMLSLSVIQDCIRVYENEIQYAETGPQLETNSKILAQWKMFAKDQHKRRRCYIKEL